MVWKWSYYEYRNRTSKKKTEPIVTLLLWLSLSVRHIYALYAESPRLHGQPEPIAVDDEQTQMKWKNIHCEHCLLCLCVRIFAKNWVGMERQQREINIYENRLGDECATNNFRLSCLIWIIYFEWNLRFLFVGHIFGRIATVLTVIGGCRR